MPTRLFLPIGSRVVHAVASEHDAQLPTRGLLPLGHRYASPCGILSDGVEVTDATPTCEICARHVRVMSTPFELLLARSSLGTADVVAVRRTVPRAVVDGALKRVDEVERKS